MTQLTDIIDIQISRETQAVAQTNFNVPLFLATFTDFSERAREYTSIEAVASDFATTSNVYIAAQKLFGQQLRPARIVIGRRQVPGATVNVATVTTGAVYRFNVGLETYEYTALAGDDAIAIVAALKTTYDTAPADGVTMTDNLDGSFTLVATGDWSLTTSDNLAVSNQPATETWVDALEAVQAVNNTWYALTCESHVQADIFALASAIEAKIKMYFTSTSDVAVKTAADTDVCSQLKDSSFFRTAVLWSASADTQFPECAWVGYQLQEQPGSNTWTYKSLAGVTIDKLTPTESAYIVAKNASTYEAIGGVNRTNGGATSGGEWIDVMVFVDWLQARMTERLWFRFANSKKIPYTQAGATIIETEVRAQLREGQRAGGLAESPAPVVITPDVLTISSNTRAQRIFEGMTFEARLAGAIHFAKIRGTVTV